jgi:hypothetical protein
LVNRLLIACLLLLPAIFITGCAFRTSGGADMDFDYLVNDLRLSGVTVEEAGAMYIIDEREPVFSGAGRYIRIEGEKGPLNIWEYSSEADALKEAKFISADGFDIRRPSGPGDEGFAGHFDWIAPPHWYQSGKIIVLYVGETPQLRILLNELLGRQFAGTGLIRDIE